MFRLISTLLDKMGKWFGIIFKTILPIGVMYFATRLAVFSIFIFGTAAGGDYGKLDGLCEVVFWLLYGVFIIMVLAFPKIASVMEFVIIPYYFVILILCYNVDYFTLMINALEATLSTYAMVFPLVAVFLAGKIMFYFFLRKYRGRIEDDIQRKIRQDSEYD